jgi:hypothetical protein
MARNLTVHARDWFEEQPIGKTADKLWHAGYQFDYVSDRQLAQAKVKDGMIETGGSRYRILVVPQAKFMSAETLERIGVLAEGGATIVFQGEVPMEASGLGDLKSKARKFNSLRAIAAAPELGGNRMAAVGRGQMFVWKHGELSSLASVRPETLFDSTSLMCIRRKLADGRYYFIANRGDKAVDGWVPLATQAKSVVIMDPLTGRTGVAAFRQNDAQQTEVRLDLPAGASVILRTVDAKAIAGPAFPEFEVLHSSSLALSGEWQVKFLSGGPTLPASFTTERLGSWAELAGTNAASFAGTAVYSLKFDATAGLKHQLDLGIVCQSARVRLNGKDYGTLITPPCRVVVDNLKPTGNLLEVEVTSTSANRIRDLDQRGVKWQNFHDINFVNLNYKKFDASDWPLADAGLLGPVTLTPVIPEKP